MHRAWVCFLLRVHPYHVAAWSAWSFSAGIAGATVGGLSLLGWTIFYGSFLIACAGSYAEFRRRSLR